jgi:ABC-2 type transport system ATP-binding protein
MEDTAIKVEGVSKIFKLPHEKNTSVKSALINFHKRDRSYEMQKALQDISFEVKKGEFFGIVGRNGSGKSTLLKLLAGIYTPTSGAIQVNGSLTPFIELGVGFNTELTGRENVFLNGALLGFNRKDMHKMYKDIVGFAELEKFMDQKLKNYSSGMQVRLAFSIAIRAKSDILLIDEVLAVGDTAFQAKCSEYFRDIKNSRQTVVLVTHDMKAVNKYCNRALVLDNGQIQMIGDPKQATEIYDEINRFSLLEEPEKLMASEDYVESGAKVIKVTVREASSKEERKFFKYGEYIDISIKYRLSQDIKDAIIDIGLRYGKEGQYYFYSTTKYWKIKVGGKKGSIITLNCRLKNIFNAGRFHLVTSMFSPKRGGQLFTMNRRAAKLEMGEPPLSGVVVPDHKINVVTEGNKHDS